MHQPEQPETKAAGRGPGDGHGAGLRDDKVRTPGRKGVWLWVALSVLLLIVIAVARPLGRGEPGSTVNPAAAPSDISPDRPR